MPRQELTKLEKAMFTLVLGGGVLLLAGGAWLMRLDEDPVLTIPTTTLPTPNAFDYYVNAVNAHDALVRANPLAVAVDQATDFHGNPGMTAAQLARVYPTVYKVAWVAQNSAVLGMLRRGLTMTYVEPPHRSTKAAWPYYVGYRELARLLTVESHARSERGDWAGAARSAVDAIHMGHEIPRGAPVAGALIGAATDSIGERAMQDVLPHLDAAAARADALELESIESRRLPITDTLREEMWATQASLLELMQQSNWRAALIAWQDPEGNALSKSSLLLSGKRQIMDNYTHFMQAIIARDQFPYARRGPKPPLPRDHFNRVVLQPHNSSNQPTTPYYDKVEWSAARDATKTRLLQLQLALRAYRLERGAYPEKLGDLIPRYLTSVPADPFGGGEPLRYRRTAAAYLLYSIGPDGIDNGGQPLDYASRGDAASYFYNKPGAKGDFVAGVNS